MRLLACSILILVYLEGFHSAPLINSYGENGFSRSRHSSNRWGRNFGIGLNLGVEAGLKDGLAHVESKNRLGFDVGGFNDDSSKELEYPIHPTPQPFDFGSAFVQPSNYYPTYGSPYYPTYGFPQFPQPNFSHYPVKYPPPYWQQYDPYYAPWQGPQYPPRYDPQNPLNYKTTTPKWDNEETANSKPSINEENLP